MDPGQAFGIVQYLEQEQANRMAQRTQRLGGLSSLLTDAAVSGMPLAGAEALAEAQPGPAGPAVQSMLSSLYPTAGEQGQAIPGDPGYLSELVGSPAPQAGQQLSPAYTQDPMAQMGMAQAQTDLQTAQLQQQQMQLETETAAAQQSAGIASAFAGFETAAAQAKAMGKTVGEFMREVIAASPENAALLQSDEGRVREVLTSVWEINDVKSAPWHSVLGV